MTEVFKLDHVDESYAHTIYRAEGSNCIVKLIHNSDGGSGTEEAAAVEFDMTHPIAGDIHVIVDYETDNNGDIHLISVVDPELGEDILPVQDEDTIAMIIELVKQQ